MREEMDEFEEVVSRAIKEIIVAIGESWADVEISSSIRDKWAEIESGVHVFSGSASYPGSEQLNLEKAPGSLFKLLTKLLQFNGEDPKESSEFQRDFRKFYLAQVASFLWQSRINVIRATEIRLASEEQVSKTEISETALKKAIAFRLASSVDTLKRYEVGNVATLDTYAGAAICSGIPAEIEFLNAQLYAKKSVMEALFTFMEPLSSPLTVKCEEVLILEFWRPRFAKLAEYSSFKPEADLLRIRQDSDNIRNSALEGFPNLRRYSSDDFVDTLMNFGWLYVSTNILEYELMTTETLA